VLNPEVAFNSAEVKSGLISKLLRVFPFWSDQKSGAIQLLVPKRGKFLGFLLHGWSEGLA